MAGNHKELLVTYHHYQFGTTTYKTVSEVFYHLPLRPGLESRHNGLRLLIEAPFADVQLLDADNPVSIESPSLPLWLWIKRFLTVPNLFPDDTEEHCSHISDT